MRERIQNSFFEVYLHFLMWNAVLHHESFSEENAQIHLPLSHVESHFTLFSLCRLFIPPSVAV